MRLVYAMLALLLFSSCEMSSKPTLNLFVWSEYFSKEVIAQFEEEYNCRVVIDTYDTNEAMYAKLLLGGDSYDIVMPSNYIFEIMVTQGMLHQLDPTNISNSGNLDIRDLKRFGLNDLRYGVPYLLSYTGLGYIPQRVENFEPSWTIFANRKYKGRMTMLNDIREVLGAALATLGYSVNTRDPAQLDEAVSLVLNWKQNLAKFESEQFKSGLASWEFLIVQGYASDILQVIDESPDVAYGWPREGAIVSVDFLAIPENASNPELAEAFINFCLQPEVAAEVVAATFGTPAVTIQENDLPVGSEARSIIFPPPEIRERAHLIRDVGDAIVLYNQAWERILNGS